MNKYITILVFLIFSLARGQQLNCTVTVDSQMLANTNQQVYRTLETSLKEFINNTDWTGVPLKQNEKINCSMYITLTSNNSNKFSGTIQVQSSRLIYNSTYSSPVFNFNDKDFNFEYNEFQNLIYNPNVFESNLVSVVAFYSYIILGINADTFIEKGGDRYFEVAQNIVNAAQQNNSEGWKQSSGLQNRYYLVNDMLAPVYSDLRLSVAGYHVGLDTMSKDLKSSKEKIKAALMNLSKVSSVKPNSFLMRTFFDAKSDEIVSIFSGGPSISINDLVDNLNKISPLNSSKWSQIKY